MTELLINDLSHLSEEEFLALCPQGEHAPGTEPLSPAAQAVLDVYCARWRCATADPKPLAAALRAAADQVGEWESAEELRAIADELEGQS